MKPQWWVNCKPLAEEAIKVRNNLSSPPDPVLMSYRHVLFAAEQRTRAGELLIRPAASEAEWYRWLETIQDWCVSRQLWWGHRIPAYYIKIEGEAEDVRIQLRIL